MAVEPRPVVLSILRLDDELSMALTDSRGLARIGKVRVAERELRRLVGSVLRASASRNADERQSAGANLFGRLFPETVRSFICESPPRDLLLQLSEEVLAVPWELSFDGSRFVGEKYAVARRILLESDVPDPRVVPFGRSKPAVLALFDRSGDDGADAADTTLDPVDALSVMAVDSQSASAGEIRQQLADFDVLHGVARLTALDWESSAAAATLLELAHWGALPPLLVVEICGNHERARVDELGRELALLSQRAGVSCVVQLPGQARNAQFAPLLYSELAVGRPIALAVARVRRAADAVCFFYGDGTKSLTGARGEETDHSNRQVTIMSYDLVDSTRMLAKLGAEKYSDMLTAYHRRCGEIIARHGGTAEEARGDDGIMCYFGLPKAREDSAASCLLAALEIQEDVRVFGVQTRIGIATGEVAVRDGLPHGVPVHLAARLQSIATPGSVVLSESTRNLVKDDFELELLDLRPTLKGIDEPGSAYRIVGRRRSNTGERTESSPALTRFVGRDNELRLLHEHWRAAVNGPVRVVRVSGEAGIGKSRLVREFRRQLENEAANVIECRCTRDHSLSAFHPVIDFLNRALQIGERDSVDTKLDKIVAGFPSAGHLKDAPALIARLFSLPFEGRFGRLDHAPERLRERTIEVLLSWFQIYTRKRPTCLIVEDANWGDPSSGEFLRRLVGSDHRVPLLVLLTLRSEAELGWDLPTVLSRVELRGLDPESARALVLAASGNAQLPRDLVRALAERGDGVPLFIEESTRMAVDLGTGSNASLADLRRAVPATIQDLLMARLDRLGDARQVAQIGATIGREFPLPLLAAVVEHDRGQLSSSLDDRLRELTGSGLLVEKGDAANRSYYFKHALVRDAAYNSLWERDRLRLHTATAEVISTKFPELCESQPELLAYHYSEARKDREAVGYWERAARHAASRSANYEAIDHLKRGLSLLERLPQGRERDQAELRLLLLYAARLIASDGYGADRVENVYRRALALSQSLADGAALIKVWLGLEGYHFMRGQFAKAREYADQAAALAERESDPVPQLQSRWAIANIVMHQGDFVAAVQQMDACLKTYEDLTHRPSAVQDPGVMCLCYSAWGLWEMGYPDEALKRAARAVDLANALRHSFSMGVAYGFRATVHHFRGEFDDARVWAERAIEVCEEAGFVVWLAHAKVMHGRVLAELGDPLRGIEDMRLGYEMWAETGAVVTQPFYLTMQSEGLLLAGEHDEALDVVDRALQLVEAHGERYYEAEIRRLRGELVARLAPPGAARKLAEAETCLVGALQLAKKQRLGSLELRAALSLAQLPAGRRVSDGAGNALKEALGKVHGGEGTVDVRRATAVLQDLQRGHHASATESFKTV